jgi:hypothetical protein
MASAYTESSVKAALERKDALRKVSFARAKDSFEKSALASGSYCVGRSEDGRPTDTRTPSSLGITIIGWLVRTAFKRDDVGKLRGRDWRDVEREAREGKIPTHLVVTENHIITAVRELKHVREGYSAEIESTRAIAEKLITINQSVANKPHPVSDEDISAVVAGLRELRPIIASKDSPLKQIVSLGRLDEAIRRYESAMVPSCKNRALEIGRACAVLASVPERLTVWRDSRIAGGVAYTSLRESALRVERDRWVFSQLARFSCNAVRVRGFVEEDDEKKKALCRAEGILDELDSLHKSLRQLRKKEAWSQSEEEKLSAAVQKLESMKTEAMQAPWADAKIRSGLRNSIRRLMRKATRSCDEEAEIIGAKKTLDGMKSDAMRLPWYDRVAKERIRKAIRLQKEKKERAACNAKKLDGAEKAFQEKKEEARRCLMANAMRFGGQYAGAKPTRLSGEYSWINRHIKHERLDAAREKLAGLVRFLDSNKPRFILDELGQSPDSYLAPMLAELGPAVAAFEAKDLKAAQKHFASAALEMRKIVFP